MALGAVVLFCSDRDLCRRKIWNPSLRCPIAEVMSLISYGARCWNAAPFTAGVPTGIPAGASQGGAPFGEDPLFPVRYTHGTYRATIPAEQTKPRRAGLTQREQLSCPGCAPVLGAQWGHLRAAALSCLYPRGILTAAAFLLWRSFLFREGSLKDLFFVGENKCTQASLGTPHFRALPAAGWGHHAGHSLPAGEVSMACSGTGTTPDLHHSWVHSQWEKHSWQQREKARKWKVTETGLQVNTCLHITPESEFIFPQSIHSWDPQGELGFPVLTLALCEHWCSCWQILEALNLWPKIGGSGFPSHPVQCYTCHDDEALQIMSLLAFTDKPVMQKVPWSRNSAEGISHLSEIIQGCGMTNWELHE